MPNWKKVITSGSDAILNEITSSGGIDTTNLDVSELATYNTVEYSNSNTMKFNQRYTGAAIGSYFSNGEYQKVITITPDGSSQNYQVIGRITAQNAAETHTVYFNAALRSNTLPDLDWTIYYDEEYNGARYIDPQLWTKETSTAGFIFAFKTLATIYGNVTVDIDVVPRAASQKANVSINSVQDSEQTSVDSGFTANDMLKVVSKNQTDVNFSAEISSSNITIDDWGSVSASLASIESTGSSQTLQQVTDNGSTTTNALTINNGTLGATSLHVDGNHQYPLKITSDSLSGDPYMELGGDGIQLVNGINEDLKIRIGPANDITFVARFEYDPISENRNFAMQGTGSMSGFNVVAQNNLSIHNMTNANTDTDKFLVLDSGGSVRYRSGVELRGDIGAGSGDGSVTSVGGTGTVSGLSLSGTVTTSGNLTLGGTISINSSNITDVDAFSQSGTYSGLRAQSTTKDDVGLGNVENTALSTWAGSANITTLGTIGTGIWAGSAIDTAYISNLSGTNTGDEPDASATVKGIIEIATNAEVATGTDTSRAITPSSLTSITKLGTVTTGDVSAILPSGVISGSGQLGIDDTDDVSEGSTNLYYTDTRVKTKLDAEGVLSGSNTISGKALGSNLDSLTVDNTTIELNSGTTYNGDSSKTISAKTGTVADGNSTLVTGDAVYDYVNPISSSLASSISSKPSKYAASGSRMAVWKDNGTVRGFDSLHYFDNGGSDIGIRLNPSSVTGRTIRTGQSGGSSGVQVLITRNPDETYGATIDYVVFNSLTNRTAYRIGREVSAWDNNGANIVGTGYTSFAFGTLPADLEVSIIESSGEMYLNMTWSGGGTYYISANIDTFGSGI